MRRAGAGPARARRAVRAHDWPPVQQARQAATGHRRPRAVVLGELEEEVLQALLGGRHDGAHVQAVLHEGADQVGHAVVVDPHDQVALVLGDGRRAEAGAQRLAGAALVAGEHLHGRGARPQLAHRALDHDAAAVDDDGPRAHLLDFVQQVRAEEDGDAGRAQVADELAHVLHASRVEAARGLVQHDELWGMKQRLGDAQALLHAVAEPAHARIGPLQQPHDLEHLVDALLAHRAGHAAEQAQVPARRHERVERGVVDEAADVAQGALPVTGHAVAGDLGVAARGVDEAQRQPDHRRLAGPVGPQKAEHVAGADRHVEAVDRTQAAELLGEGVGGKDGGAAVTVLPVRPRPPSFPLCLRYCDVVRHATVHVSERNLRKP